MFRELRYSLIISSFFLSGKLTEPFTHDNLSYSFKSLLFQKGSEYPCAKDLLLFKKFSLSLWKHDKQPCQLQSD